MGLKENVLIGKLIPAGTGMPCYNEVEVKKINTAEDDEFYEKYGSIAYEEEPETEAPFEVVNDSDDFDDADADFDFDELDGDDEFAEDIFDMEDGYVEGAEDDDFMND